MKLNKDLKLLNKLRLLYNKYIDLSVSSIDLTNNKAKEISATYQARLLSQVNDLINELVENKFDTRENIVNLISMNEEESDENKGS